MRSPRLSARCRLPPVLRLGRVILRWFCVDPVQLVLYDLFLGVIECGACGGNIGINFFIIYVNYRMYRRRGGGCTTTNYCGVQGALCLGHDAIRDALWASDSTDLNFGTHIAVHMVADAPPCHCCALLLCHAAVFCCPPRIPYLRNEVLELPSDMAVLLVEMDRNTQSQVFADDGPLRHHLCVQDSL